MKTAEQKLEQVKRIMKVLRKRGQNNEAINTLYRELLVLPMTKPISKICTCPCHRPGNIMMHIMPCC